MFGEWIGDKIVNPASTGDFYEGAESFVVRVNFKVTKVKTKHFDDIGDCYNLYISNLVKL